MKKIIHSGFLVTAATIFAITAQSADAPRVSRAVLGPVEKSLDDRINKLWEDSALALLGPTRGVYLDGYGVVFTAEVNLVAGGGTTLMHPTWSKEDKERQRKKKLDRLPQLKAAMKQAMVASAASLDPVLPDDQVVVAVFLTRYPWEDSVGLPVQVTMQATKKKLLEAQRSSAGLDQAIQVKEF